MSSFNDLPCYLFTSESVTEGHPDKLCDQVADGILDKILKNDPDARVACEVAVTVGLVIVLGEITTNCYVDIPQTVREVVKAVGYTKPEYQFDYQSCGVLVSIKEQSGDISAAVSQSAETRVKERANDLDTLGAGDQGMMTGFACNETPELMPLPISLAHRLCRRLAQVRKEGTIPYLRPDGKSQVTVEYCQGVPKRVSSIVLAAHHDDGVEQETIRRDLVARVIEPIVPPELRDAGTSCFVNSSGRFVIGGPVSDTGCTGRKLLVDTYGGFCRIGGGSFSGKDPTKVDRSAAYMARYVAKNVVAAGLADRIELQIAYSIGVAHPLSVSFETFNTAKVSDEVIMKLITEHFDLRPAAIIRHLDLRRPIYRATAAYGAFGRDDLDLPWERTDKAQVLKAAAGL